MKKILLFIILSFSTLLKTQKSLFTENQKFMYNEYVDILSRLKIPDKFQNKQDEYKADKAISLSLFNSDFIRYLYTDNKFVRRNTELLEILFNKLSNSKKVSLLKDILIKNKSKDTVIELINYVADEELKNKLILDLFNALKSKDRVILQDKVELFNGLEMSEKITLFGALKLKDRVELFSALKTRERVELFNNLDTREERVELFSALKTRERVALFSTLKTKERVSLIAELKEDRKTEII